MTGRGDPLHFENLTVRRGGRETLTSASFTLAPGECVGLIGPNGAGKTTLLRAALGLIRATGRSNLSSLPPKARARRVAWMPQERTVAWPVPVDRLVALGRTPYLAGGRRLSETDRTAIDAAVTRMDLAQLRDRPATELSGGELARALIARVLAQDTPFIFADEPAAGLDPAHQIRTLSLFRNLARDGRGLILSLHDLALAARHCTRLILMHEGRIVADGSPRAVLSERNLADVFGLSGGWSDGVFRAEALA